MLPYNLELIQALISAESDIDQVRYSMVAMGALQIYEWLAGYVLEYSLCSLPFMTLLGLISLEQEIRLVHRNRWTLIKTLYMLCRYYPLLVWVVVLWAYVGNHSYELCMNAVHPAYALLAPCVSPVFALLNQPNDDTPYL